MAKLFNGVEFFEGPTPHISMVLKDGQRFFFKRKSRQSAQSYESLMKIAHEIEQSTGQPMINLKLHACVELVRASMDNSNFGRPMKSFLDAMDVWSNGAEELDNSPKSAQAVISIICALVVNGFLAPEAAPSFYEQMILSTASPSAPSKPQNSRL